MGDFVVTDLMVQVLPAGELECGPLTCQGISCQNAQSKVWGTDQALARSAGQLSLLREHLRRTLSDRRIDADVYRAV